MKYSVSEAKTGPGAQQCWTNSKASYEASVRIQREGGRNVERMLYEDS